MAPQVSLGPPRVHAMWPLPSDLTSHPPPRSVHPSHTLALQASALPAGGTLSPCIHPFKSVFKCHLIHPIGGAFPDRPTQQCNYFSCLAKCLAPTPTDTWRFIYLLIICFYLLKMQYPGGKTMRLFFFLSFLQISDKDSVRHVAGSRLVEWMKAKQQFTESLLFCPCYY